jgi:hypothetical protein
MNTHGRGRFVVAVAAVAAISAAGGTDALASASCTAANSGALNADLPAGGSVTRELALDAGDTLGITSSGASATLVSGAGAPLALIAVGGAAAAILRAPQVDTFAVRFSAGADGPAMIRISCTASAVDVDEEGRPRQVAFSVSLSEITAAAGQKPQPGLVDLWLEGRMQNYAATPADLGPGNGNLGILYFGTR